VTCTRCHFGEAVKLWRDEHLCVDCYLGHTPGTAAAAERAAPRAVDPIVQAFEDVPPGGGKP
jgi:hypothetical protein